MRTPRAQNTHTHKRIRTLKGKCACVMAIRTDAHGIRTIQSNRKPPPPERAGSCGSPAARRRIGGREVG